MPGLYFVTKIIHKQNHRPFTKEVILLSNYVNCGALLVATGQRVKTKKALRELMRENPALVEFDPTSVFYTGNGPIPGDCLHEGYIFSVVGPDPYTKRNWYASVRRLPDGTVRVD